MNRKQTFLFDVRLSKPSGVNGSMFFDSYREAENFLCAHRDGKFWVGDDLWDLDSTQSVGVIKTFY